MAKLLELLPSSYGYVFLVAAGGSLVNMYLQTKVMGARKKHSVKYPQLYSATNEKFNCVQRSHQNYLENYPFFISSLVLGGLQYPRVSAVAGLIFLIGRLLYARGYSTGGPEGRVPGAVMAAISQMVLLGNVVCLGVVHSGIWECCMNMIGK